MNINDVWIGLVHVKSCKDPELLDGAIGAYVSTVALAENSVDFIEKSTTFLEGIGFVVIEIEDVEPLQHRLDNVPPEPSILNLVDGLSNEEPVAVSTFDAYESE